MTVNERKTLDIMLASPDRKGLEIKETSFGMYQATWNPNGDEGTLLWDKMPWIGMLHYLVGWADFQRVRKY